MRFLVFKAPAFLYMGLIFYLSSGPITSPVLNRIPDYYLHGVEYAGLYVLIFWATHEGIVPAPRRGGFWLPLLLTACYGLSDEIHQSAVPQRDASLHDLVSDVMGGLLGGGIILAAARIGPRDLFGLRNLLPRSKS